MPKSSPKASLIANLTSQWLRGTYGFEPSPDQVDVLASRIERELNMQEWGASKKKGPIMGLYFRWAKSQGWKNADAKAHSAIGFASWLRRHFWVITIRKFWRPIAGPEGAVENRA